MLSFKAHLISKISLVLMVSMLSACMTVNNKENLNQTEDIEILEEYGVDSDVTDKFNEAVKFINEKAYKKALPLLIEVTKHTKKHSAPYVNLGVTYAKLGKIQEAEASLLKALKINPNHPVTNNEIGIIYRQSGRFAEAKQAYERVLLRYPSFLPARINIGILCDIFMNDLNCAIEHYDAYLKYKPDDKKVAIWLIDLKRRAGKK